MPSRGRGGHGRSRYRPWSPCPAPGHGRAAGQQRRQVAHRLGRIALQIGEVAQHDLMHVQPPRHLRASPHQVAAMASLVAHSSGLSSAKLVGGRIVAEPRQQHAGQRGAAAQPVAPTPRRRRDRPGPRWRESRSGSRPCRTGCRAGIGSGASVSRLTPLSSPWPHSTRLRRQSRLWSELNGKPAVPCTVGRHRGRHAMGPQAGHW